MFLISVWELKLKQRHFPHKSNDLNLDWLM